MGKDLNTYFSKGDIYMANRYVKRISASLITREMQTTTTMTYHLKCVRTAIIKKKKKISVSEAVKKKEPFVHCWWDCKLVQPLWEIVWSFLKKLDIELPYDPAIPLLGIYPKKMKVLIQKDICTPCSLQHYLQ